MRNKLVSVIVPVYNVEKYLNECIDSIIKQSFKDIEILLIDDGSTDKSGEICDKYKENDKRIRVFHKENGGVSSARNLGLKNIRGDYVLFIDPDDYVEINYVEKLINNIKKYDMIACGYYENYKNNLIEHKIVQNNKNIDFYTANNMVFSFDSYKGFLWNKAFRTDIIKYNNILFDTNIHMCEDQLFVITYLQFCSNIYIISDCLYYYRMRKSSIASGSNKEKLLTLFDAYYKIKTIYEKNKIDIPNFMYIIVWDYYNHKKYISHKYYDLLEIKETKNKLFFEKNISVKRKIKLFVKVYFPFIYRVRDKYRNQDLKTFE